MSTFFKDPTILTKERMENGALRVLMSQSSGTPLTVEIGATEVTFYESTEFLTINRGFYERSYKGEAAVLKLSWSEPNNMIPFRLGSYCYDDASILKLLNSFLATAKFDGDTTDRDRATEILLCLQRLLNYSLYIHAEFGPVPRRIISPLFSQDKQPDIFALIASKLNWRQVKSYMAHGGFLFAYPDKIMGPSENKTSRMAASAESMHDRIERELPLIDWLSRLLPELPRDKLSDGIADAQSRID